MNRQRRLLLYALHRYKPHRRTADRLADRLRVPVVVLVAFDIRLHIGRRHQSDLVAVTADHPPPMVRATTGLNANRTWRKLCKEFLHRAAPKLAPQHNPARCINPVDLKHVLRQIQTNCANLVHGRLPCLVESTSPVWHTDAVGGRPLHLSGLRHLAQARNPYSRSWLWIPGSLALLAPRSACPIAACSVKALRSSPRRTGKKCP